MVVLNSEVLSAYMDVLHNLASDLEFSFALSFRCCEINQASLVLSEESFTRHLDMYFVMTALQFSVYLNMQLTVLHCCVLSRDIQL